HDQAVQKILLEHLEPTGCTALTVARADEARQHLRDGIDLVVADYHLDGVDWLHLPSPGAGRPRRRDSTCAPSSPSCPPTIISRGGIGSPSGAGPRPAAAPSPAASSSLPPGR